MPFAPSSFDPRKGRDEMMSEARKFGYDIALSPSPTHMGALKALLGEEGKDHILFGSDFPSVPGPAIGYFTGQLDGQSGVDVKTLRESALNLFPRLRR